MWLSPLLLQRKLKLRIYEAKVVHSGSSKSLLSSEACGGAFITLLNHDQHPTGQSAPKALLMFSPSDRLPARATFAATNAFSAATLAPSTSVSAQLIAGPVAQRVHLSRINTT